MTYTTVLIFTTLMHGQSVPLNAETSPLIQVEKNTVNSEVIDVLEKRGLARISTSGAVTIEIKKIEGAFSDPEVIDNEILDVVMRGPATSSW